MIHNNTDLNMDAKFANAIVKHNWINEMMKILEN